jgi:hypothetical protein
MKLKRALELGAAAFVIAASSISHAAKISVEQGLGGTVNFITIQGKIIEGDGAKFKKAVAGLNSGVVYLISEGGLTFEGIEISAELRAKNLKVVVPTGKSCASSCGIIWLGSMDRYLAKGARVGFHAAWETRRRRVTESGVGNAILGSYLGSIGLSMDAIYYVTQAPPSSINWLSQADAARVGIQAKFNAVPDETLQQLAEKADPQAFSRARRAALPIPIPRPKPIEVLMMSAENMRIEPAPELPPSPLTKVFYERIGQSEENSEAGSDTQSPLETVEPRKQIYARIVGDKEIDFTESGRSVEMADPVIEQQTKSDYMNP